MTKSVHTPVLLSEVLAALAPKNGELFVDGTFGGGGYTQALLAAADCRVAALDRDTSAIAAGQSLQRRFADRLVLSHGVFSEMESLLAAQGIQAVDGVALDVGVSSDQIDTPARGFSFMADGPLDMRMGNEGMSAADVVNELPVDQLANIFWTFGEERRSRAIARAIGEARAVQPITRTLELADICTRIAGRQDGAAHPATRTFQALRIYVNDELGELLQGLAAAERLLKPQGRLAVVTFHSLEDRITKRFLDARSGHVSNPSRHAPAVRAAAVVPSFVLQQRGGTAPSQDEIARNPRARSARLRSATRTNGPAHPLEPALLKLNPEIRS